MNVLEQAPRRHAWRPTGPEQWQVAHEKDEMMVRDLFAEQKCAACGCVRLVGITTTAILYRLVDGRFVSGDPNSEICGGE